MLQFPFLILPMVIFNIFQLRLVDLGSLDPWSFPWIYIPGFDSQVLRLDVQDGLVLLVLLCFTLELVRAVKYPIYKMSGVILSFIVFLIGVFTLLFGEFTFNSALFILVIGCGADTIIKAWLWRRFGYAGPVFDDEEEQA